MTKQCIYLWSSNSSVFVYESLLVINPERQFAVQQLFWVGPCEKVSQNIDPFKNHFFVINYQHWTGASALQPFWVPPDPWGGLGGPGGVWGGLPTPKLPFLFGDQFQPWNAMFWVKTTCNTMFLRFGVKWGPPGSKNGRFGPK